MKVQHFFAYQKSWAKRAKILEQKRGDFFCLVSHLIAPKSWTRKNKGAFFLPTKNPGLKKNEGETFFAY